MFLQINRVYSKGTLMDFNKKLVNILSKFIISGEVKVIKPFGNGHINRTFYVETTSNKYVLQSINTYAFPDVDLLMGNINIVSSHLRNKGYETLGVICTKKGGLYTREGHHCYRVFTYVDNSICHEELSDLNTIRKAGEAFGELHSQLFDLDSSLIQEVIADFHNTPKRYENLVCAIEKDRESRLSTCLPEAEKCKSFADKLDLITKGIEDKNISVSITHNDPKINNVLFDEKTDDVRCVIDLDTVMPGSVLYDFGDALRSLFTGANEDSEDLSNLVVNIDIYKAYLTGYLSKMGNKLNQKEIDLLPYSVFLLTAECGMRFLEDYLRGDVYFYTKYPTHNLVRCRTQLTLAQDIYNKLDLLNKITKEIVEAN